MRRLALGWELLSVAQFCRWGPPPVWTAQDPQTGHPPQTRCLVLFIPKLWIVKLSHPSTFWRRCMDDTLTALPRDLVEPFHEHLNSIDANIQLDERESDGKLPFLDVLLTRAPLAPWCTARPRTGTNTWPLIPIIR